MRVVRLLIQLGQLVVIEGVAFLGSRTVAATGSNALLVLIFGVATAAVALLTYVAMARLMEHRPPAEIAGSGAASGISDRGAGCVVRGRAETTRARCESQLLHLAVRAGDPDPPRREIDRHGASLGAGDPTQTVGVMRDPVTE